MIRICSQSEKAKITKLKGMLITVTMLHTNILHSIVQMESILKHTVWAWKRRY
jgi:hypothetical protein